MFQYHLTVIWNTVTVTELPPWWGGAGDGTFFTFDSDEFEIVLGPVGKWIDGYNKLNRVLQKDKDGNKIDEKRDRDEEEFKAFALFWNSWK